MTRSRIFLLGLVGLFLNVAVETGAQGADRPATHLLHPGPSPQRSSPSDLVPPPGVERISYRSSVGDLAGWLAVPNDGRSRHRAVVFVHGGFAFGRDDYEMGRPFLDAGYAVLYPTVRGENGNPGSFEMMYGEVDDVLAAVRWLRAESRIDPDHVALFGHSIGAGEVELTTLVPDRGVMLSGSAGGLYPPDFRAWKAFAPFDTNDAGESARRSLIAQLPAMKGRHVAYVGNKEAQAADAEAVRRRAAASGAPLTVVVVPGDHFGAVTPAIEAFLKELAKLP